MNPTIIYITTLPISNSGDNKLWCESNRAPLIKIIIDISVAKINEPKAILNILIFIFSIIANLSCDPTAHLFKTAIKELGKLFHYYII